MKSRVLQFMKPTKNEAAVTYCILEMFASATGLITNIKKTEFFPIRCEDINLDFLAQHNRKITTFPTFYLGLPLHSRKPTRAMYDKVIEKIDKLLHKRSAAAVQNCH
jgi:hypothetical protein